MFHDLHRQVVRQLICGQPGTFSVMLFNLNEFRLWYVGVRTHLCLIEKGELIRVLPAAFTGSAELLMSGEAQAFLVVFHERFQLHGLGFKLQNPGFQRRHFVLIHGSDRVSRLAPFHDFIIRLNPSKSNII